MADRSDGERTGDRDEFAAYVTEIAGELAAAARRHRLDALAYLLEMASLEASHISKTKNAGGDDRKHARP